MRVGQPATRQLVHDQLHLNGTAGYRRSRDHPAPHHAQGMRKAFTSVALPLSLALTFSAAHAQTVRLPDVDCAKNSSHERCTLNRNGAQASGSVGDGNFGLYFGGFTDEVTSGFVDPSRNLAFLPLETLGQMDGFGGVISVDLATGNRTLISGRLDDSMPMRGKGAEYINYRGEPSTEWGLGRVRTVRPGLKPGTILALQHYGSETRTVIVEIDIATGNRTIVWANNLAADSSHSSNPNTIQNQEARLGINANTICGRIGVEPTSFEVYKGSLFVFSKGNTYKVQPGVSCNAISLYDATNGTSQAGSGDTPRMSVMTGSWLTGNEVTFTSGPGATKLLATNLDTGARRVVSAFDEKVPNRGPGKGTGNVGYLGTHVSTKDFFITTGYTAETTMYFTRIDQQTGDRKVMEGKGSLARGNSSKMHIVASIPGTNKVLVFWEKALHVMDADTGYAYVLSQ